VSPQDFYPAATATRLLIQNSEAAHDYLFGYFGLRLRIEAFEDHAPAFARAMDRATRTQVLAANRPEGRRARWRVALWAYGSLFALTLADLVVWGLGSLGIWWKFRNSAEVAREGLPQEPVSCEETENPLEPKTPHALPWQENLHLQRGIRLLQFLGILVVVWIAGQFATWAVWELEDSWGWFSRVNSTRLWTMMILLALLSGVQVRWRPAFLNSPYGVARLLVFAGLLVFFVVYPIWTSVSRKQYDRVLDEVQIHWDSISAYQMEFLEFEDAALKQQTAFLLKGIMSSTRGNAMLYGNSRLSLEGLQAIRDGLADIDAHLRSPDQAYPTAAALQVLLTQSIATRDYLFRYFGLEMKLDGFSQSMPGFGGALVAASAEPLLHEHRPILRYTFSRLRVSQHTYTALHCLFLVDLLAWGGVWWAWMNRREGEVEGNGL
jgi:hypothetical protein